MLRFSPPALVLIRDCIVLALVELLGAAVLLACGSLGVLVFAWLAQL